MIIFLHRSDPTLSLNYSVLLYKMGEKQNAAKQFAAYEKRFSELKKSGRTGNIDSQVKKQKIPNYV